MLALRRIGAPRIVSKRRVVLDVPYVTSDGIVLGDYGNEVVKIDKKSLKEAWRKRVDLVGHGGHGDLVCLRNGKMFQVWHSDGRVLWKRTFPVSAIKSRDRLWVVHAGGIEAVDLGTGKTVESFPCPRPEWAQRDKWFLNEEGSIIAFADALETDQVTAFDLRERRLLWERSLRCDFRERLQVEYEGGVFFWPSGHQRFIARSRGRILGLGLEDGGLRWVRELTCLYPPVKDGRIYVWATGGETAVHRTTYDPGAGQVMRTTVAPSLGENRFVILDAASGEIVLDRSLAAYGAPLDGFLEPLAGTLCRNHIVFTIREKGFLFAFRLSDGELVWRYEHPERVYPPTFDENRLYVCCADGTLVVFEAEGEEL